MKLAVRRQSLYCCKPQLSGDSISMEYSASEEDGLDSIAKRFVLRCQDHERLDYRLEADVLSSSSLEDREAGVEEKSKGEENCSQVRTNE